MVGALPQEMLNKGLKMHRAPASGSWADAKQDVEPDQVFPPRTVLSTGSSAASVSSQDLHA